MKRAVALMLFLVFVLGGCAQYDYESDYHSSVDGPVYVKGYYRKDGTYVQPHTRTRPDGIKSNNKSYRGKR